MINTVKKNTGFVKTLRVRRRSRNVLLSITRNQFEGVSFSSGCLG